MASYRVVDAVVVAPVSGCCSVWLLRDSRRVGLPCASDDFVQVVSRVPPDFGVERSGRLLALHGLLHGLGLRRGGAQQLLQLRLTVRALEGGGELMGLRLDLVDVLLAVGARPPMGNPFRVQN
ncbi:hypothetical protein D7V97_42560 [Corallococcus sp. CA053C]|nr:hypothetical protein D7V97_42560 [Corallococcus sp. CA053C]